MIDKPKRKNGRSALTRYDDVWLFYLYRWLRLAQTRHIAIAVSPEMCIERLKHITDTPKHAHKVEFMTCALGYQFQMQIWEPRGFSQPDVNGLIEDDGYGQSNVTLRTYPKTIFVAGIMFMIYFCQSFLGTPSSGIICGLLFAIFMFFIAIISEQADSLDRAANQLTQTLPLALDQDGLPLKQPRRPKNMQRKS